ncbi:MAG: hypothetical protein ACYS22_05785 [Planctomycetota bacterium]|jgi:hypothetical protein
MPDNDNEIELLSPASHLLLDVMGPAINGEDVAAKVKQAEKLAKKGYKAGKKKASRNKRKVFYTLSGPGLGVAGGAIAASIAGGPFTLGAATGLALGALAGKGLMKIWRNGRAKWEKGKLCALQHYARDGTVKLDKDTVNSIRFWIQKKRISKVADELELAANAIAAYSKMKPNFKSCKDAVLYVSEFYKAVGRLGLLKEDFDVLLQFWHWIDDQITRLEGFDSRRCANAMKLVFDQVALPGRHGPCKKPCYALPPFDPNLGDEQVRKVISPLYQSYTNLGPWKQIPLGRCWGDAASRVFGGKNKAKIAYTIHTNEVIQMAYDMGVHTKPAGISNFMVLTGFPGQPKEFLDNGYRVEGNAGYKGAVAEIKKVFKADAYVKDPSKSKGGEAAASLAAKSAATFGKSLVGNSVGVLGKAGAQALASDEAYSVAIGQAILTSGATMTGGAVASFAQTGVVLFGEWANLRLELHRYFGEKSKESPSDVKLIRSLRTILKDGGRFEGMVDQLSKAIEWYEVFDKLESQKQLKNCQEASDLAIATLEVWKHRTKMNHNRPFVEEFIKIIATYVSYFESDELMAQEVGMIDHIEAFMAKHPDAKCEGVCYRGEDED